jgi:hypothetical protein
VSTLRWEHGAEGVVRTTTGLRFEKWTIAESAMGRRKTPNRYPQRMEEV